MCAAFICGYFVAVNDVQADENFARKGVLIAGAIAMGGMAIKGRWPFGGPE